MTDSILAQNLISRLIAHKFLPREDGAVIKALTDDQFRNEVDQRLHNCGLRLLENPYADHVSVGVIKDTEESIYGAGESWISNNLDLRRDSLTLLYVIWIRLILPKRQAQLERQEPEEAQTDMLAMEKAIPRSQDIQFSIAEATLLADLAGKLGSRTSVERNIAILTRLNFIIRRMKDGKRVISEGPLLDLAFDYSQIAPRILNSAFSDLHGGNKDV